MTMEPSSGCVHGGAAKCHQLRWGVGIHSASWEVDVRGAASKDPTRGWVRHVPG